MSVDQRLLTIDRDLTQGERLLRDTAAAFVDRARRGGGLRAVYRGEDGAARSTAREAAQLGWSGILVPLEHGGPGATLREAAVVFEQLGHGPVWGSLFTSGVVAAQLIAELGGDEQRARLLPDVCSGTLTVAPAILDAPRWTARSIRMQAPRAADGSLALSGVRRFVLGAGDADTLLCAVRVDGTDDAVALALVDARQRGVSLQPVDGLLHDVWDVHLDGVRVAAEDVLGARACAWAELERALAPAILLLAAYTVGACDELFTETVAYTRVRRVFGQTIGRFQRVQDHCVELSLRADAVRLVTDEAIEGWMQGNRDLVPVHEARSVATESYYHGCNDAHMVHAGPGTALDHPLMPHTVMSRTLFAYLGDPASHRRAMVDRLLGPAAAVAS